MKKQQEVRCRFVRSESTSEEWNTDNAISNAVGITQSLNVVDLIVMLCSSVTYKL
jgi:hypothetical protein